MFGRNRNQRTRRQSSDRRNHLRRSVTARPFNIEHLDSRTLLAADLGLIDEGFRDGYLANLQNTLNTQILSVPAPFVGDALADDIGADQAVGSQFLTGLNEKLQSLSLSSGSTIDNVRTQFAQSLGIAKSQIVATRQAGDRDIRFQVNLAGSQYYDDAVGLQLVGADPELELLLGNENVVDLQVNWTYGLAFGVREDSTGTSTFYVDDSAANELTLDYTATVNSDFVGGKGRVGVFVAEFGAGDQLSQYNGGYVLDVDNSSGTTTTLSGSFAGSGDAHLAIEGSFFPSFLPSDAENPLNLGILADGVVSYTTGLAFAASGAVDTSNNQVSVSFDNVSVDLGSIYRDFVDPLITNLQDSLRPIKPVVDFLTQPLPVISDLYEMAGLGPQTVVSLAGYGPNSSLVRTLNIVDAVLDYTGPNSSNVDGPEALFSFEVSKTGVDPQTAANREEAVRNNLKKLDEGGLRFELAEKHQDPDKHRDWQTSLSWKSQFDGSIDLPFLTDFETLAGLLLGDTQSEMFTFDVNASFGFDVTVDVPIVPLLNLASLTGRISFALDLDLDGGYDATGIKRLTDAADFSSEAALRSSLSRQDSMLLAGFYLDDHNSDSNSDHGRLDAPEATFTVEMGAGLKAGIDLLLMQFELGGEIVLESNLNFDLNDLPEPEAWSGNTPLWSNVVCYDPSCTTTNSSEWQYDGRVRLAELATIVDADPGAIFNMDGALKAGFDATLDVSVIGIPIISERWQLLRMTLVNGNLHQPNDAVIIHGENPPELAVINKSGVLTLHMGDDAWKRNRDASVTDEVFTVQSLGTSKDGGETVMVTFESNGETYTQFFQGVTRVRAYGGTGNDTIQVLPGIEAGALIVGGDGDDVITYGGSGKAILVGNAGNDFITGGSNNDRIIGYDGDDHLDGGAGNDYIVGGAGNDKMIGGAGNDQLTGNIGDDFLDGGDGVDRLYGSAGDDILRGGNGTDYVFGQAGNDRIQYGFLIDGDAAVDQMLGGPHRDTVEILGTENADVFTVQQLSNGVFRITNAQNATFRFRFPESITDRDIEQLRVSGMGGDDHIEAIGNFDVNVLQLDGGEGDDTLIGAESRNELLGGAGDDMLIGGSSRDILRGGDGSDTLRGGGSNDALYGDDGDDDLNGEEGTDVSRGGNGNDTIDAGVGLLGDMIYGDAGDDTLNGGDGVDIIFGGMGNDTIHGGALGDTLIGDEGDDYIVGGTGRDFIFGGDGNDQLFALSADSLVDALEATDDWREVYSKLLERENDIINVESPGNQSEINDLTERIAVLEAADGNDYRLPGLRAKRDELVLHDVELQNELAVINTTQNDVLPKQVVSVDVLDGGLGDDQLTGSPWTDRLVGGEGDDTTYHTSGLDIVVGGNGTRDAYVVNGTVDSDNISIALVPDANGGTPRVDVTINGKSSQANQLEIEVVGVQALAGNDTVRVDFGKNAIMDVTVEAGAGNDFVDIGIFQGSATLSGGDGVDRLRAELIAEETSMWLTDSELRIDDRTQLVVGFERAELIGNAANNTLDARKFSGSVTLRGGDGDDALWSAGGSDIIDGGAGNDLLGAEGDVNFTLSNTGLTGQGSDSYSSVERAELIGGAGNNRLDARLFGFGDVTLRGGAGNDSLYGGKGNDWLYGGDGDDWIEGGPAGYDWINGNPHGIDRMYGGNGNDQLRGAWDYLYGEAGNDVLYTIERTTGMRNYAMYGGTGNDQLYGGSAADTLYGGDGNDSIFAGAGNDTLYGGNGDDLLYGNEGNDTIYGEGGRDQLYGHAGNDYLNGGSGNDLLYGDVGADRLVGSSGDDHLNGGNDGRKDTLEGGSGNDSAMQYRYWVTTVWPFGYWVEQESLSSIEDVRNRDW